MNLDPSYFSWLGLFLGLSEVNWWFSFALVYQWCCLTPLGSPGVTIRCFCRVLSSDYIGVGRFRISGGGGGGGERFRLLGAKGGGRIPSRHMTFVTTSMGRINVASTSFRRYVPTRFLKNQCQIHVITFMDYP